VSKVKKVNKVDAVERLRESITAQKGAVIAENLGLTVAEITRLRKSLREADVEFRVVKNTLTPRRSDSPGPTRSPWRRR